MSCGSRVVPWGLTDRETDMRQLTVAFRNFANAPKKSKEKLTVSLELQSVRLLTPSPRTTTHWLPHNPTHSVQLLVACRSRRVRLDKLYKVYCAFRVTPAFAQISSLLPNPPQHPRVTSPFALEKPHGLNVGSHRANPLLSKQFLPCVSSTNQNVKKNVFYKACHKSSMAKK